MFKPPEPLSGSFPKLQATPPFFDAALGVMAHEATVTAANSEDDGFTAENAAIDACSRFPRSGAQIGRHDREDGHGRAGSTESNRV